MSEATNRPAALRRAVLAALLEAEVSGLEILTKGIDDYRPLTWFAPGIYPYIDVGGEPPTMFQSFGYLNWVAKETPVAVYEETLFHLRYSPTEVLSEDKTWLKLPAKAFGMEEEARVVFSGPEMIDGEVSEEAGYTFAMEFAAACTAAGMGPIRQTSNDFYVEADDGWLAGIKDGRIISTSPWDTDIRGYVEAYATMNRGGGWTTQSLDVLDRMSFWFEGLTEIPDAIAALPEMLAVLKASSTPLVLLSFEQQLYELKEKLEDKLIKAKKQQLRVSPGEYFARLEDCQAVLVDWRVNDQQRVARIFENLVPGILSEGTFGKRIVNLNKPVLNLTTRDITRISNVLDRLKNKPARAYANKG